MHWVLGVAALVVIVGLALAVAGRLPEVPQPTRERFTAHLPTSPTLADLDALRFPVVFRGYRMEDVDAALLALRARIAELEQVPDPGYAPPPAHAAGAPGETPDD
jgi:DivIVA domain-containing protein